MQIAAGEFSVPGGTGVDAVTCGFEDGVSVPDLVVLFGSNDTTEDSVVNTTDLGVFFGLIFRDYASPSTLIGRSWSLIPDVAKLGHRLSSNPVQIKTAADGTVLFEAAVDSFGADSFSLNWTTVASGKVKFLALSVSDEDAQTGGDEQIDADATLSLNWRPRSAIGLTAYTGNASGDYDPGFVAAGGPPQGFHFCGAGMSSYPLAGGDQVGVGVECSYQFQQDNETWSDILTNPRILQSHHFGIIINTIIGGLRRAQPTDTTWVTDAQFEADTWDTFVAMQAQAAAAFMSVPLSSGDDSTFDVTSSNPEQGAITAVIFMAGGRDDITNGIVGACGFGVWTPDYQGCVYVDGNEQSLFQSSTRAWCARVDAGGAIAGTADVAGTDLTITNDVDTGPTADTNAIVFMAFGDEAESFVPQIYRWVRSPHQRVNI